MSITARQFKQATGVAVTSGTKLRQPEPGEILALFPNQTSGAQYLDDTALGLRICTLPTVGIRIVLERQRVRVEDLMPRKPGESNVGTILGTIAEKLFPGQVFVRYGFNYDTVYRYDTVVPSRQIIGSFLDTTVAENVTHFGWQFSIPKEKGKRRDTYFCKMISPLEIEVLANIEVDEKMPTKLSTLQSQFEAWYAESEDILDRFSFTDAS